MRAFLGLFLAGAISTCYALFPRQDGYPACTQSCLANATSSKCLSGEVSCLCQDSAFINSTTTCFQKSCSASDFAQAVATAQQSCKLAGVTLSSTPASSPTATSPSAAGATVASAASSTTSSTPSSKPNSAGSTTINIIGGAAALGLVALAL